MTAAIKKSPRKPEPSTFHVYVEGANPSGRDIQNLCIMIETSVVLATMDFASREENEFTVKNQNKDYEDFLMSKYAHDTMYADDSPNVHALITDMYHDLSEIHSETLHHNQLFLKTIERLIRIEGRREDDILYDLYKDTRQRLDRFDEGFKKKYKFIGSDRMIPDDRARQDRLNSSIKPFSLLRNPRIRDMNEWIARKYGNSILETESVSTKNSIEFWFQLASIGTILGCQEAPAIKEIVLYTEAAFKNWMGKSKIRSSNLKYPTPTLSSEILNTIAKFDEAEYKQDENGYSLRLKKGKSKKRKL